MTRLELQEPESCGLGMKDNDTDKLPKITTTVPLHTGNGAHVILDKYVCCKCYLYTCLGRHNKTSV